MNFKKLENLRRFERIVLAPNELQLDVGGPKRPHVHSSCR